MEKLKIAIIGAGWVSQAIHLPILKKSNDIEVVAICDKDKSKAKSVAEKFNIKHYYSNAEDIAKMEDVATVLICSSTDAHKEHSIIALESKKDVFVEKPLARKFDEAKEIVDTATKNKKKLMVGMNNRFRPDIMALRGIIEAGDLGKIFYVKSEWIKRMSNTPWFTQKEKSGGGVFIDLGIVMLDLAMWMNNYADVKTVSTSMYSHSTKNVEDTAIVWCRMKNNEAVNIEVSWSLKIENDYFNCNVFGTNGSASINPLKICRNIDGNIVNLTPIKTEKSQNLYLKSYENELKHFFGAVKNLHPIISTGEEALKRMQVVEAIYNSAKTNKEQKINK